MLGDPTGLVSMRAETFNALQEDALRYRYLQAYAQALSRHRDGTASWIINSRALRSRGSTLEEVIDRGRAEDLRARSEAQGGPQSSPTSQHG